MEMNTKERLLRRAVFDSIVDVYDAGRPSYPDELFDDLLSRIVVPTGAAPEVLEIGCGTGQASRSLVERGCVVTAIELGPRLAEKAQQNLAAFGDRFRVVVGDFETVRLPAGSFDLVASASAFHWVDPMVGLPKVVHVLRATGILALWGMGNARDDADNSFFDEVRSIYDELGVPRRGDGGWRRPDGTPREAAVIDESGLFGPVETKRYPRDITYTRDHYLQFVASHSRFQVMPPEVQQAVTERIGRLIDEKYGGSVVRHAMATLYVARPLCSQ